MKVTRKDNEIVISDFNEDDLKQLYIRVSLSNSDIIKAMGNGYGDKKLPDNDIGCLFCGILDGIWEK